MLCLLTELKEKSSIWQILSSSNQKMPDYIPVYAFYYCCHTSFAYPMQNVLFNNKMTKQITTKFSTITKKKIFFANLKKTFLKQQEVNFHAENYLFKVLESGLSWVFGLSFVRAILNLCWHEVPNMTLKFSTCFIYYVILSDFVKFRIVRRVITRLQK